MKKKSFFKRYRFIITILVILVLYIAWYLISPFFIDKKLDEPMDIKLLSSMELNKSTSANNKDKYFLAYSGDFEKVDYEVEGGFALYKNGAGEQMLRIENLDIVNGPDLYLVLSNKKPSFWNMDYKIVAPLRANIGSFNVEVPKDINFGDYKYLLIHCRMFSHTFAAATIHKE